MKINKLELVINRVGGANGKEPTCQHKLDPWVPWRRKWQPTAIFLPGQSVERGSWWATIHNVAKRQTQLKQLGLWHINRVKFLPIRNNREVMLVSRGLCQLPKPESVYRS